MDVTPYTSGFFRADRAGALASARRVVPLALQLIEPDSVVDVGCGIGAWLHVFAEHGIDDYLGIDGDYVQLSELLISADKFRAHDLAEPLHLGRQFDLALSLEVGEHLPPETAAQFVCSLVRLAPIVLFSGAIPGQRGLNHVNEQWPRYWGELFGQHGYQPLDVIRPRIWEDASVEPWYAQNMLLFIRSEELGKRSHLRSQAASPRDPLQPAVHPRMHAQILAATQEMTSRQLLRALPGAIARSVRYRINRVRGGRAKAFEGP